MPHAPVGKWLPFCQVNLICEIRWFPNTCVYTHRLFLLSVSVWIFFGLQFWSFKSLVFYSKKTASKTQPIPETDWWEGIKSQYPTGVRGEWASPLSAPRLRNHFRRGRSGRMLRSRGRSGVLQGTCHSAKQLSSSGGQLCLLVSVHYGTWASDIA